MDESSFLQFTNVFCADMSRVEVLLLNRTYRVGGTVLLGVGCFALLLFFGLIPGAGPPPRLTLPIGIIALLCGLYSIMRGGCIFDATSRTIERWWGFGFKLWVRRFSWDDFRAVQVRPPSRFGLCMIFLTGPGQRLLVNHTYQHDEALRFAAVFSEYLGLENWERSRPGDNGR